MQFDLSYLSILLQSIVVAVVIVLAVFAWRWLRVALGRGQLGAENEALAQVAMYAKIFVAAAEQTMSKQPGFARLNWVLEQFDDVLPDVDKNLIRSFVEAAVKALPADPAPAATSGYVSTGSVRLPVAQPEWIIPPPPPADGTTTASTTTPPVTSHSHRSAKSRVSTEG